MNGCHSKYLHCALLVNISLMRWKSSCKQKICEYDLICMESSDFSFSSHSFMRIIAFGTGNVLYSSRMPPTLCLRTTQFKVGSTSLARNHKVGGANRSNIKWFCYQNRPRSISRYVIISSIENITIRTALERWPYATHMHIWKMQHNTIKPAGQQCLVAQRPHKPHEITNSDYRQHSRKM